LQKQAPEPSVLAVWVRERRMEEAVPLNRLLENVLSFWKNSSKMNILPT